ncbi:hypothetical protein GW17_00051339 [Ensete ventricosum]|nr:hypothetical protein GW17_00051339 [Ensete ventricosum]
MTYFIFSIRIWNTGIYDLPRGFPTVVSEPRQQGGAVGHGQATCKGAAGCSQGPPTKGQLVAAKPPPPQGAAARRGITPQGAATRKEQQPTMGDHPWARSAATSPQGRPPTGMAGCSKPTRGYRPQTALPPAGAAAPATKVAAPSVGRLPAARLQGDDCQRPPAASPAACAGAATATAQRGAKRGLGHPFEKRMILPL